MAILKIQKKTIVDGAKPVRLKGVNLGGWLMPEGYIMHAPNRAYQFFKKDFISRLGEKAFYELEQAFRDNFMREDDIARIKTLGFNSVRVPFHFGLIEKRPYEYSKDGVAYLDRVIAWAKKQGIWVILDMHAVPGAQNHDWHSDSNGQALFWTKKSYQNRAALLWQFLADRYKDETTVAGYDLLNETVLEDPASMNTYYHAAIKAIRSVDRNHIIFVEGNRWAQDIACLDDFEDDNLALGIHFYEPLEFTFNFVPGLAYPLGKGSKKWDGGFMRKRLEESKKIADKRGRVLWCGEFGVNARFGVYHEEKWLKDVLSHFHELDIHWHYWTWKAIKNAVFPDGIYSYLPNAPWVNRSGPLTGWETYYLHWQDKKKTMAASWRTKAFQENKNISQVLKNAARKDQ